MRIKKRFQIHLSVNMMIIKKVFKEKKDLNKNFLNLDLKLVLIFYSNEYSY